MHLWQQPEIVVLKKTKRSEKEVDIKPMIYEMSALDDGIYLYLATGSEQNLKPDLVAEAFLKFAWRRSGRNTGAISTALMCMQRIRTAGRSDKTRVHFAG